MKASLIGLLTIVFVTTLSYAQQNTKNSTNVKKIKMAMEQEQIINLSNQKWQWMADKNVEELNKLFNEKAVFVHMGGTMTKAHELDIIKAGGIQYKKADIEESSVQILGNTAILLNKIKLTAIVGGNEVINPFVVTEVYTNENKNWTLSSMSFTKLLSQ
jgi:hypothetical protein